MKKGRDTASFEVLIAICLAVSMHGCCLSYFNVQTFNELFFMKAVSLLLLSVIHELDVPGEICERKTYPFELSTVEMKCHVSHTLG